MRLKDLVAYSSMLFCSHDSCLSSPRKTQREIYPRSFTATLHTDSAGQERLVPEADCVHSHKGDKLKDHTASSILLYFSLHPAWGQERHSQTSLLRSPQHSLPQKRVVAWPCLTLLCALSQSRETESSRYFLWLAVMSNFSCLKKPQKTQWNLTPKALKQVGKLTLPLKIWWCRPLLCA